MACSSCGHDQKLSDGLVGDALKNEQAWIDIGLNTAKILERVALALPAGDLREEALSQVSAIRTTPMYSAKRGPKTRKYPLPDSDILHGLPFENDPH